VTQRDSEVTATALMVPVLVGVTFSWEFYHFISFITFAAAQAELMHCPLQVGGYSLAAAEDPNPAPLLMQEKPIGQDVELYSLGWKGPFKVM